MIHDLETLADVPVTDNDVVVVGGGTVALLLASLLAKRGVSVLLLESGGESFEPALQELNEATVTGRKHAGISLARARALGGTSNLWGGQLTPFVESDFMEREGVIDSPWPISYDEVFPYYAVVTEELELPEDLSSESPLARKVFNDGIPTFSRVQLFFTRWLKEPNFAYYFRGQLESSRLITVLLHAHATRLVVNQESGAISAVEVTRPDGIKVEVKGNRFILANGTIEISRLLLLAANSNPIVPWASNTWVGRGFQDHLELRAGRVIVDDKARFLGAFQNVAIHGNKYQPKLRLTGGAALLSGNLNVTGFFSFESSIGEHLQHLKVLVRSLLRGKIPKDLRGLIRHLRGIGAAWIPMVMHYLRNHRIYSPSDRGVWLTLHCEQLPLSDSRIKLDFTRTDRFGSPLAALDWRIGGQQEISAMAAFVRILQSDLEASGIARIEMDATLDAEDIVALDSARDTYHQCGGARMGHSSDDGVVDRNLKVFGTPNLYIIGAAVFRTSSYANPTFTALALTARLADQLATQIEDEK